MLGRDHAPPTTSAPSPTCDLVIESIVEDLPTKRALFAELEQIVKPTAILATNTSTLPVVELAMATQRPDQVCGIHFFNPAPMMKLVEVVRPLTASDETIETAMAFATACGKDAVEVNDRAGFIVNALLFPYLNNAVRMWEQGTASKEAIDTAMKGGCNFPMGPFALLDLVGLDTSVAILDALYDEFRDPNYAAGADAAADGHGRPARPQAGRGFYRVLSDPRCRASARASAIAPARPARPAPVERPTTPWHFPSPRSTGPDGFAGVGADLEPGTLLAAYRQGMFPMPAAGAELGWWSPDPRVIIPLDGLPSAARCGGAATASRSDGTPRSPT